MDSGNDSFYGHHNSYILTTVLQMSYYYYWLTDDKFEIRNGKQFMQAQ
jgi:hypothetical protein